VQGTSRAILNADHFNVMQPAPTHVNGEGEFSRFGQIVSGVVICALALFIVGISVFLFFSLPLTRQFVYVAVPTLLICGWILNKGICTIVGRRKNGGLFAPWALRIAAVVFLLFPVGGLFTGYYQSHPPVMWGIQLVSNLAFSLGLFTLAARRTIKLHNQSTDPSPASVTSTAGQPPRQP
jgi:O-antigen/teichoic acid export membrane protein